MTLVLAMLLDAFLGEPRWLWSRFPHPAVMMGRLIGWCDETFNTGTQKQLRGTATLFALVVGAAALGVVISALLGAWAEIIIAAILLAQRSLVEHVSAVANALRLSVADGRQSVAMIVSRDTSAMNPAAIARSAIESAAENLSDGVIAPIFWFAVAGLPGLLVYKITNTADSMIGYRTPRHAEFGWAAARFDDLLNLIPARLTALLLWAVTNRPHPAGIFRDAPKHRSPNAGWPEAAMAYGLDIALAGPRSYDGMLRDFPFVNADGEHSLTPDHIDTAVQALWRAWLACLSVAFLWALL